MCTMEHYSALKMISHWTSKGIIGYLLYENIMAYGLIKKILKMKELSMIYKKYKPVLLLFGDEKYN